MKRIAVIFGGGTVYHVRPHLALSAPAYGHTARRIKHMFDTYSAVLNGGPYESELFLTKMAGGNAIETNEDVRRFLASCVADKAVKMIFMSAALCDFEGSVLDPGIDTNGATVLKETASGKDQPRLKTSDGKQVIRLLPADKLIGAVRKERKDIFLVGFKTTAGATEDEQFEAGLRLLKTTSCNLVLANDVHTRINMIVTPELARYSVTKQREEALYNLVEMAHMRAGLSFSRTRVLPEKNFLSWGSTVIPASLQTVVDYCVSRGAYQPFNDVTVGHFAFRWDKNHMYSSRRKQNFNRKECRDLVRVEVDENEIITAYGAKPSAGARSQWAVLNAYPDFDCIVHFHCPMKEFPEDVLDVRSQREFECGSHECGENTKLGLKLFLDGEVGAVMLDRHGPNIIFRRNTDPGKIIEFIERNFDLTKSTSSCR